VRGKGLLIGIRLPYTLAVARLFADKPSWKRRRGKRRIDDGFSKFFSRHAVNGCTARHEQVKAGVKLFTRTIALRDVRSATSG
jgi:hypothetical protein